MRQFYNIYIHKWQMAKIHRIKHNNGNAMFRNCAFGWESNMCMYAKVCHSVFIALVYKKPIRTYHTNVVCRALPSLEFNRLDIACVFIRYDDKSR